MTGKFTQIVLCVDYFCDNSIIGMVKRFDKLDSDMKRLGYMNINRGGGGGCEYNQSYSDSFSTVIYPTPDSFSFVKLLTYLFFSAFVFHVSKMRIL